MSGRKFKLLVVFRLIQGTVTDIKGEKKRGKNHHPDFVSKELVILSCYSNKMKVWILRNVSWELL